MGKVVDLSIGSGVNSVGYKYVMDNYAALSIIVGSVGELAYVKNSQGTSWLPGTIGGSFYPKGTYLYDGANWVSDRNAIASELNDIISDVSVNTGKMSFPEAPIDGNQYVRINGGWQQNSSFTPTWVPPSVPIGGLLTLGATFYINSGGGIILELDGSSDDSFFSNDSLNRGGWIAYDGSDLAVVLKCRLDANGGGGDNVKLRIESNIYQDGDNSNTGVTNSGFQTYDVSSYSQYEMFELQLPTISGVAGGDVLGWQIQRNGTGPGQDTFNGALEILGVYLKIV